MCVYVQGMYFIYLLYMKVVMGLLDLVLLYAPPSRSDTDAVSSKRYTRLLKFTSEVARKALNLMIILRPVTMVTTLAKEVSTYLASQHVTNYPHSSIQPVQVHCIYMSSESRHCMIMGGKLHRAYIRVFITWSDKRPTYMSLYDNSAHALNCTAKSRLGVTSEMNKMIEARNGRGRTGHVVDMKK